MALNDTPSSLVILGLGSNLGDSKLIIHNAVESLKKQFPALCTASLYETEPMYVLEQNRFVNSAVSFYYPGIADTASAHRILSIINNIEASFGRDRSIEQRWGQRFLDIDILLFGDLVLNETDLEIPHPRLKERRFALEPLLEICPDAKEPGSGLFYKTIRDALLDQGARIGSA